MAVLQAYSDKIVTRSVLETVRVATVTDCLGFVSVYPGILGRPAICLAQILLLEPTVTNNAIAMLRILPNVIQRQENVYVAQGFLALGVKKVVHQEVSERIVNSSAVAQRECSVIR